MSMKYVKSAKSELKEILTDEVKEEIIAFLNTRGGTIYVGVTDRGEVEAVWSEKEKDEMEEKISNWINDAFYPNASKFIHYHFNDDGVFVIDIEEGADKPYYLKEKGTRSSGVYKRVGTSSVMVDESEILLMILDSRHCNYEEDVPEEQELTFSYFKEVCLNHNLLLDERNMTSLRMINKRGEYTNLALWMSDQSPLIVKFAKYDENRNFLVKKEYSGSLLKILDNVLEKASNYNDVSSIIDENSWARKETISYPGASLREAILNAFAHANYFIRSNIKIEFFIDKVRIINPGDIYEARLEHILNDVQTYRNPGLVNILNKLGYIENFGTGIHEILDAYRDSERKPLFEPSDNFFILTLPNLNYRKDNEKESKEYERSEQKGLSRIEIMILSYIKKNEGCNATEIQKGMRKYHFNPTLDMVKNSLKRNLADYVEFIGAPKNGGYYVKRR